MGDGRYSGINRAPHRGELSGLRASAEHSRVGELGEAPSGTRLNMAWQRLSRFVLRHRPEIPGESLAFMDGHACPTEAGTAFGVADDPRRTWARQFYDALCDLDAPGAITALWCIFADSS